MNQAHFITVQASYMLCWAWMAVKITFSPVAVILNKHIAEIKCYKQPTSFRVAEV